MSLQLLLAALFLPCRGQSDCPGKGRTKEGMLKEVTMKKRKPKGMQLMVVYFVFSRRSYGGLVCTYKQSLQTTTAGLIYSKLDDYSI